MLIKLFLTSLCRVKAKLSYGMRRHIRKITNQRLQGDSLLKLLHFNFSSNNLSQFKCKFRNLGKVLITVFLFLSHPFYSIFQSIIIVSVPPHVRGYEYNKFQFSAQTTLLKEEKREKNLHAHNKLHKNQTNKQ